MKVPFEGSLEDSKARLQDMSIVGAALTLILVVAVIWSLLTCWFLVDKNENSVVTRFGAHVRTVGPGLQFKAPWPIEEATEVEVENVSRIQVGYRTVEEKTEHSEAKEKSVEKENEILTADMNIVVLDFVVQYKISDAAKWLFSVKDPDEAVRRNAQSAMRMVVGGAKFDDVATSGRAQIQKDAETKLKELCASMDFGAHIISIQLQDVHPPDKVMNAFKDVQTALEDKEKTIQQARGYEGEKIPWARGEAQTRIERSLAFKDQKVNWATGDRDYFQKILKEYQSNPLLTRQRMQYDTLQEVMKDKEQTVTLDPQGMLRLYSMNR